MQRCAAPAEARHAQAAVDPDKLRAEIRHLPSGDVFLLLDRALEQLPEQKVALPAK